MARFAGTALTDYFNTPDFTTVGKVGMEGQSMQRNAATKAEGLVHGAGVNSMAEVAQAGFHADATKAIGQAQGQAAMMSGLASGISGLAGGFGSMGGGGGAASAIPKMSSGSSINIGKATGTLGGIGIPTGY